MSNVSKLVLCVVMLCSRHSGLPIALDRAIVFPTKFVCEEGKKVATEQLSLAPVATNRLGEKFRAENCTVYGIQLYTLQCQYGYGVPITITVKRPEKSYTVWYGCKYSCITGHMGWYR